MKQWQIFLMAGLFLAVFSSFENAEATSPVSIVADRTNFDIMEDGTVTATLTLENTDSRYRTMEVYLGVSWVSGTDWNSRFTDANYDDLPNNEVNLTKGASATVLYTVYCNTYCEGGDTNVVRIIAHTDPRWYPNGNNASDENNTSNETNTCGSDDCETDTSPASESSNTTNMITMTFTARTGFASSLSCGAVSSAGDNLVSQNITSQWSYTLTNTGWNTDNYQFTGQITSADGHDVSLWTVSPGLVYGKELTGTDTSLSGSSEVDSAMQFTPALTASPGIYNVELTVISNNGGQDSSCNFDVVIPEPETEEVTTADPANETAEKETEEEIEEIPEEVPEEVPSLSLITALISIGIIALRRRY